MSTTPTPDQTQALSLFTLLFSAPPGSWKDALFQVHAEAGSLPALANLLVGLPQFQSRFAGDTSPAEILDTFLSFVGLVRGTPAHGAAAAAILSQLEAGASVGLIAVQVLQFLQGTSEPLFQTARQYLANLVEVASYHTVTLGLQGTSVEALRALVAGTTSDPASVAPVKQALDKLAAPPPDSGPPAEPPPAITSADSVPDIAAKLSAYGGAAATANATGMTAQQLEALGTHAARLKADGITHLSLVLGDALMTDAISAALLGKAGGASVTATGASTTEVSSLATLAAHIAAGGITGSLDVTPIQLADVRGVLAPKLAAGLLLSVNGTAAADLIDLTSVVQSATAAGYAGDDIYVVDSLTHTIAEAGGGGTDTLQSAVSIALPANVEVLSLIGSANIDATGSAGDDTLIGNSGNNLLTGAVGNDVLQGNAGNDTLDGGTGADTLAGGAGNDVYVVDDAGDAVTEAALEGTDTVSASLVSYTLSANVEVLSLVGAALTGIGNAGNNTIHGTTADNQLSGGNGNDVLYGNDGLDTLNGGAGNDSLYGGNGNDLGDIDFGSDYFDGDAGDDIVTLIGSQLDGVDTLIGGPSIGIDMIQLTGNGVFSFSAATVTNFDSFFFMAGSAGSRSVTLGSNVTNDQGHVSIGVAGPNTGPLTINASALGASTGLYLDNASFWDGSDSITGGAGNDSLVGGGGNDSLVGNGGNDSLVAGTGADMLIGGAGDDSIDGGDGNDQMSGGDGNDSMVGGDGVDYLRGGYGADTLDGGSGADTIHYRTGDFGVGAGVDEIVDFVSGTDTLAFQIPVLAAGMLSSNSFANLSGYSMTWADYSGSPSTVWNLPVFSGKAVTGYFILVLSDNRLVVDPDGSGATTGYEIAILTTGASTLTNADIVIT